jgi:hypothetical protein
MTLPKITIVLAFVKAVWAVVAAVFARLKAKFAKAPATTTPATVTSTATTPAAPAATVKHGMLFDLLMLVVGPLGRIIGLALLGLALLTAFAANERNKEKVIITEQAHQESQIAIKKSTAARKRAVKRFDSGWMRNDGFARD